MSDKVAVIVTAAGSGTRLAQSVPKAAVQIKGQSILEHAIDTVLNVPHLSQVIITVPHDTSAVTSVIPNNEHITVVAGGDTRKQSVAAGLAAVEDADYVLVHDAARCFTPLDVYKRVLSALQGGEKAVIPALPVVDTIKKAEHDKVTDEVKREELVAVQTPQGFETDVLNKAHQLQLDDATDDAMLAREIGVEVSIVPGDERSMKITRPLDLKIAEIL